MKKESQINYKQNFINYIFIKGGAFTFIYFFSD